MSNCFTGSFFGKEYGWQKVQSIGNYQLKITPRHRHRPIRIVKINKSWKGKLWHVSQDLET